MYVCNFFPWVSCWAWIGWSLCVLRGCEWTQSSLSHIIRHSYSRVQYKSKQSSHRWSCCIRILSFRHVNKHAVTSTGCVYCSRVPFAFLPTISPECIFFFLVDDRTFQRCLRPTSLVSCCSTEPALALQTYFSGDNPDGWVFIHHGFHPDRLGQWHHSFYRLCKFKSRMFTKC